MKFILRVFVATGCWSVAYGLTKMGLNVDLSYWVMGAVAAGICITVNAIK